MTLFDRARALRQIAGRAVALILGTEADEWRRYGRDRYFKDQMEVYRAGWDDPRLSEVFKHFNPDPVSPRHVHLVCPTCETPLVLVAEQPPEVATRVTTEGRWVDHRLVGKPKIKGAWAGLGPALWARHGPDGVDPSENNTDGHSYKPGAWASGRYHDGAQGESEAGDAR